MLRHRRRAVWLHQGCPGRDHPARHGRNPARCHHGRHHGAGEHHKCFYRHYYKTGRNHHSGSAYTVNQALDALTNYYGKGYDVDGTVSEGNNYYFAVYKN